MIEAGYILAGLLLLLALHPFITYPLSLTLLQRLRPMPLRPCANQAPLRFAICVCAYNEEAVIRQKAENLLAMRRACPGLQILVYVDCSSDRTADILRAFEPEITLHVATERRGKTYGMNLLIGMADADILIFTDADILVEPEAMERLGHYFSDPEVGCVGGQLTLGNTSLSATAQVGSLYWNLERRIRQMESHTGSTMGADGAFFAIRRSLHREPPPEIIDDLFVSLNVMCDGYRVLRATDLRATGDATISSKEEMARKIRIGCQSFNVHRMLWPRLRRLSALDLYKYVSHKLLRWVAFWTLCAALLILEATLFAAGHTMFAIALPALAALCVLLGLLSVPLFRQGIEVLRALLGSALGVVNSLAGRKFQTWTPPESARKARP